MFEFFACKEKAAVALQRPIRELLQSNRIRPRRKQLEVAIKTGREAETKTANTTTVTAMVPKSLLFIQHCVSAVRQAASRHDIDTLMPAFVLPEHPMCYGVLRLTSVALGQLLGSNDVQASLRV